MKCSKCGKDKSRKYGISLVTYQDSLNIGVTEELCEDCMIRAQIELRDFVKQSKYYTEIVF